MTPVVVLDACVLVPIRLASLLLTLAHKGVFVPRWSEQILEETVRALNKKLRLAEDAARHRVEQMQRAFPEAAVTGYQPLMPGLGCDKKDRHVLAAAIAAGADSILTANLADFPAAALAPYDIEALHPDAFLLDVWADSPDRITSVVTEEAARFRNPPMTATQLLAFLAATTPNFANVVNDAMQTPGPAEREPLLVVAAPQQAFRSVFSDDTLDLTDPAQVGFLWASCLWSLPERRGDLELLSLNPSAFGDYAWAVQLLGDRSLASKARRAVDAPDWLAFMYFVPETAQTAQVAVSGIMRGVQVLTLVKLSDGTWRVFGLGPHHPSADEVLPPR